MTSGQKVGFRPHFPAKILCENGGGVDPSVTCPQPPGKERPPSHGPSHGVAEEPSPGEAVTLPPLCFLWGPHSHQGASALSQQLWASVQEVSYEGATGPPVILLGHSSFEGGIARSALTALPVAKSLCTSDEEQTLLPLTWLLVTPGGACYIVFTHTFGGLFARTSKPGVRLKGL